MMPAASGTTLSFPQQFRLTLQFPYPPSQHEQRVAEPVQQFHDSRFDRFLSRQPYALALGPPAHGPGMMEEGGDFASTRKNELLERSQILLAAVDHSFEMCHILRGDPWHVLERLARNRRQNPAC